MRQDIKPITFRNKNGHNLFGMLHIPEKPKKNVGIIILSPGIKSRVAPHRLYVKMAEYFCALGFTVLRFDFYGLGDSEGEVDEKHVADFYGSVQVGRYVDDTIAAMDWLEKECGISKFVLAGLCGGAITGLLTGAKDKRVECLMGQSIPIILDSSNIVYDEFLTDVELEKKGEGYLGKLFDIKSWHSWIRFLTFRSDYRLIYRSVLQPLLKKNNDKIEATPNECNGTDNNKNPLFPKAFESMVSSGRNIFLIFAEADRLYWQFEENFRKPYQQYFIEHENNIRVHVIKKANHIFSFSEWQEEMLQVFEKWLTKNYLGA